MSCISIKLSHRHTDMVPCVPHSLLAAVWLLLPPDSPQGTGSVQKGVETGKPGLVQGGPHCLPQGSQHSIPSPLCGENTEEGTVEAVGRGQSNSLALEASSVRRHRVVK